MALEDHPTVIAVRARSRARADSPLSAQQLKTLAKQHGADDVGIVEVGRPALADQRPFIEQVYPSTRALLAFVVQMNREPVRSAVRSVANQEFHATYDAVNEVARDLVRTLSNQGIAACNSVAAFPMEVQLPGRGWMVAHKPVAVEAGLGRMGLHRNVIHPKFGSFVLLGTVLLGVDVDSYDQPIDYNPCLDCNLCVAACPVSAIKPDGAFDFTTCYTHNYREFLGNFGDWVGQLADAKDAADYRRRVSSSETNSMWQSLAFKPGYKAAYCVSVCPAGEDVIGPYLDDRKRFVERVVQPLRDKPETLYVLPGSDAENDAPKRFPKKTIRRVGPGLRTDSVQGSAIQLWLGFQRGKARGVSARVHLRLLADNPVDFTLHVHEQRFQFAFGHKDPADVTSTMDSRLWLQLCNRERDFEEALAKAEVQVQGSLEQFRAVLRCFPNFHPRST